jgi:hypothetical protein
MDPDPHLCEKLAPDPQSWGEPWYSNQVICDNPPSYTAKLGLIGSEYITPARESIDIS